MKKPVDEKDHFEKIVLVSADGDYKKMVDYLIKKERFEKILFPNKKYRFSLYNAITHEFFDYPDNVKDRISLSEE